MPTPYRIAIGMAMHARMVAFASATEGISSHVKIATLDGQVGPAARAFRGVSGMTPRVSMAALVPAYRGTVILALAATMDGPVKTVMEGNHFVRGTRIRAQTAERALALEEMVTRALVGEVGRAKAAGRGCHSAIGTPTPASTTASVEV